MKQEKSIKIRILNIILILALILISSTIIVITTQEGLAFINSSVVLRNGTHISTLRYDNNSTYNYTSYSYKDNSVVNPDAYLKICTNESYEGKYAALAYSSTNCNTTLPLLVLPVKLDGFQYNCTQVDIDIASYRAFYPGVPYLLISNTTSFGFYGEESSNQESTQGSNSSNQSNQINTSQIVYCSRLNTTFNGSYDVSVSVDDIDGVITFSIRKVFDDSGSLITLVRRALVVELINGSNYSLGTRVITPSETARYNYTFKGHEKFYVNGLLSLEIIPFDPCGVINQSGYYMLNSSSWNVNDSCVIVENVTDVVINFANKTVDGDAESNGSLKNNTCAVIIRNSANVSIHDLRTEQFMYGLCVFNSSSVSVSGTYDKENVKGVYIVNSSGITVSNLEMSNNDSEILLHNAAAEFNRIEVPSANFSLVTRDTFVKTVSDPPQEPEGLINISQWLLVNRSLTTAWAVVKFHYTKPLPNNVLEATLDIYKYNGSNWSSVPSYTDKIRKVIYTDNISTFSIFAPLGEEINMSGTPETPPPPPPSSGTLEQKITQQLVPPRVRPPKLRLKLYNKTVRVQQGGTVLVGFNLTNVGDSVTDVMVKAFVKKGWKTVPIKFERINSRETKNGTIYIKVYENEIPKSYLVSVSAIVKGNMTVDTETLRVIVVPREKLARLEIIEAPPALTLIEKRWHKIPVLVENNGDFNLTNITMRIEYADECIEKVEGKYNLSINERKSIVYRVKTKRAFKTCEGVLVLTSSEGGVAFTPIRIDVVPRRFGKPRIMPILFLILTILSIRILIIKYKQVRVIKKGKKRKKKG